MKLTGPLSLFLFLLTISASLAQSIHERELAKLETDRDIALSKMTAPIYMRYRAGLQQLIKRATQAGDLEAANKIQEALKKGPTSGVSASLGQSVHERELAKLAAERDAALLPATNPIYTRFRVGVEQIMKKATQAGDLEGANKIQEVLNKIPAAARLAKPVPKTRKELATFLHGTVWELRGTPESKGHATMTFNKDGTMKYRSASENRTGAIQFLGPRSIKLWNYDPAELNDDLNQFRAQGAGGVYHGILKE